MAQKPTYELDFATPNALNVFEGWLGQLLEDPAIVSISVFKEPRTEMKPVPVFRGYVRNAYGEPLTPSEIGRLMRVITETKTNGGEGVTVYVTKQRKPEPVEQIKTESTLQT